MKMHLQVFGCVILTCALAGALLHVSQLVQNKKTTHHALTLAIENEKNTLRILESEWTMLNAPQRLETIAIQNGYSLPSPSETMITTDILHAIPYHESALPQLSQAEFGANQQGQSAP